MGAATTIQWTDTTWNPVRGCTRVSSGCDNCYAMGQAHRFAGPGKPYEGLTTIRRGKVDWKGSARLIPEQLAAPLRWRKPQRIFVNSMSDLFHESLSDHDIDAVFGVMWACLYLGRGATPGHIFQILTKRPERARDYFAGANLRERWATQAVHRGGGLNPDGIHDQVMFHKGPHPRIWLGVSVENQKTADERIPTLLGLPAAVRFISAEPLLGSVDLKRRVFDRRAAVRAAMNGPAALNSEQADEATCYPLNWVIVGGESGPGARPCNLDWIAELAAECRESAIPCFVKQLGAKPYRKCGDCTCDPSEVLYQRYKLTGKCGSALELKDKKGGDVAEWPEALRVRQFPMKDMGAQNG